MSGAYSSSNSGGSYDAYISKLSADLSSLKASTYLGGTSGDIVNFLTVDTGGIVTVVGGTGSSNFPTTEGAFDQNHNGGSDVFYSRLNNKLGSLLHSTFIGGSGTDTGYSAYLDDDGFVYLTGTTSSSNFPVTSGAYQTSTHYGGAFLTKIFRHLSGFESVTFMLSRLFYPFSSFSLIADPVDASTGAHLIEKNILNVNGAMPIDFKLQYNSLLLNAGPMGKGWVHNYETRLNIVSLPELFVSGIPAVSGS